MSGQALELALVAVLVVGAVVYLVRRAMHATRARNEDCGCGCTTAPERRR